jgi:hypothetical protein
MDAHTIERNIPALSYEVDDTIDYGYEDHYPDPRHDIEDAIFTKPVVPSSTTECRNFCNLSNCTSIPNVGPVNGCYGTDATEVSQSPSPSMKDTWSKSIPVLGSAVGIDLTSSQGINLDSGSDDSSENEQSDDMVDDDAVITAAAKSITPLLGPEDHIDADNSLLLYPPMPPDRQARKQRSFRRRGGELHGSLLKSAVMASMSLDFDDSNDEGDNENFPMGRFRNSRRESCHSSISLQSLQDALRSETSPRKRARRGQRRKSFDDDDDGNGNNGSFDNVTTSTTNDTKHGEDMMEASDLFVTMRVGGIGRASGNGGGSIHKNRSSGTSSSRDNFQNSFSSTISDFSANAVAAAAAIVHDTPKREPPPRRVSRKTSYDSRVSDYDSDFDPDEWDD